MNLNFELIDLFRLFITEFSHVYTHLMPTLINFWCVSGYSVFSQSGLQDPSQETSDG